MEFNNDFLEKNKSAIIEEMGKELSFLGGVIDEIIGNEPNEHSIDEIKNLIIAMSYKLGSLTTLFNQYYIMLNGFSPEQRKIGFQALLNKEKNED